MPISLPDALAEYAAQKRWLVWRYETPPGKKRTKVPYQPEHPSWKAKNNDPSTWSDYARARAVYDAGGFDGIGLCILGSDIVAFDVDDCRNSSTGAIHPWAARLIERAASSYTEITPSGEGLRIIGRGIGTRIKRKLQVADGVSCEPYRNAECYITVTGNALPGTSDLKDISPLIDQVVAELGGNAKTENKELDIDDVDDIAPDDPRLAPLADKWVKLAHDGEGMEAYGNHRSRAVMAFACECFRAGIGEDAIASCLVHWKIGEHIRDQASAARSLNRVLTRARQFVEDSKLFEMNQQHAVLPIGGKTRVATWGEDLDFPGYRTITQFSSFADFRALHDKYRHTYQHSSGETKVVPLGSWWIANPHRRQYDGGMKFMPTRDEDVVDDTLNMWQGFAVSDRKPEGKSGAKGCQLFLDHGLKIICNGDADHYDYLMKREAFIAQRRTRSEIAVGLKTEIEGTGKGFWERVLNYLYGQHAMQVQKPEHVVGKHNKHIEILLRLTADEALFALNPHHRNALYSLITEPTNTIEPKFVDVYPAINYVNVDVISNAQHFLYASGSARRLFVPTVSANRANDHEYFRKIQAQLCDDGGYEALLYHLLHEIDIRDFNVRAVPKTAALIEQAAYSRKGVDLLVEIACNEGRVPCPHNELAHVSVVTGRDPRFPGFDYFVEHHRDQELSRMGPLMVTRRLAKDWGCVTGKAARTRQEGERVSGIIWPDLADLRSRFVAKHGPQTWLHPEEEVWGLEPF
jgi:Family of unknown function (DUF5906)